MKPDVCEQLNRVAGFPICDFIEKPSVVLEWSREFSLVIMISVFVPYFSLAASESFAFGVSTPSVSRNFCTSTTEVTLYFVRVLILSYRKRAYSVNSGAVTILIFSLSFDAFT